MARDTRKHIDETFWGMHIDDGFMLAGWIFIFAVFTEFVTFSTFLLGKFISTFGMLEQYLIGALLSLEICFILFSLSFKKKPTFTNVLAYKGLSLVWGISIYNIILIIGIYYNRLGEILMRIVNFLISMYRPLCIILAIVAAVGIYFYINYLITKAIERKEK